MRRLSAALTVVALLLVPACSQASAQERIALAATKTQDAGTARMAMKMDMLGGAQDVSVTAEGVADFASQKVAMTMDLGALGEQAGMGKMEMVSEGTTVYMKFPNHKQLGLPTAWLKMDLEKMAGLEGMESLSQMNNDPSQSLEMLRGVSDEIEEVGTEDVRGTSTTHYKADINVDKALAEMPEEARASFKRVYADLGVQTLPAELWLDDEGLLRRQKVTVDMSKAKGAAAAGPQAPTEMVMDIEFYDFGAEVDAEPPPASEVTDFDQLQGAGG
jgi:hypothetical protein